MKYKGWNIIETACFPNAFQVHKLGWKPDNGSCYFHPSIKTAKAFIDKHTATNIKERP
jgi:hypothetical protein